jgi:biopolymer transport protein TolR
MRMAPTPIKADINVTPLVDVVLVLLIIFMVVTPYIDGVHLPATAHPAQRPDHPERLLITIDHDRTIRVGGDAVPPERLGERLKELFAKDPGREVVLKADKVLPYGDVKRALLAVRDAGFGHAGLITMPGGDRGAEPGIGDAS